MSKFRNSRRDEFLASIPVVSLEADTETLAGRCKFNFSYFTKQQAGQDFAEWEHAELLRLIENIREFCREPLLYWEKQRRGKGSTLAVYGKFPAISEFSHPKHVPHDVCWARFRLTSATRLVGFVVPSHLKNRSHEKTGATFDCNTFYVVFLDRDHKFWSKESK